MIKSKKRRLQKRLFFSFSVIPGDPSPIAQNAMATEGRRDPEEKSSIASEGVYTYVERKRAEIENEKPNKMEENAVFQPYYKTR